jgi:hypothetical protein
VARDDDARVARGNIVAATGPSVAAGVAAAAAGMAGVPAVGAALIAGALDFSWRMERAAEEVKWERRGLVAVVAADRVGGDEALERLATIDDVRRELTARVLRSAEKTPVTDKLRALAKVLADGLDGSTPLDGAFVLAEALNILEGVHVEVLRALCDEVAQTDTGSDEFGLMWWTLQRSSRTFPHLHPVVAPVPQALMLHGLIREPPRGAFVARGEAPYSATDLGRLCLILFQLPPEAVEEVQ